MKLFGKKPPTRTIGEPVAGLPELAAARHWPSVEGVPVSSELADEVHRLAWVLQGLEYSRWIYNTTDVRHSTVYRDAYAVDAGGHRMVVANAWTNIGPQKVVHYLEMTGIALCVAEHCKLPPFIVQPAALPLVDDQVAPTPTGDADFDGRFVTRFPIPGTLDLMSDDIRRRIGAHDDWAFACLAGDLLVASTGAFRSADAVAARLDEVVDLVAAFEDLTVAKASDPETAALLERASHLTTLEDALALLFGLNTHERDLLANSNTPLAPFAHVTTEDEALATFQAMDKVEHMRLMAMLNLEDG